MYLLNINLNFGRINNHEMRKIFQILIIVRDE